MAIAEAYDGAWSGVGVGLMIAAFVGLIVSALIVLSSALSGSSGIASSFSGKVLAWAAAWRESRRSSGSSASSSAAHPSDGGRNLEMLLTRYGLREWTIITLVAAALAAAGVYIGLVVARDRIGGRLGHARLVLPRSALAPPGDLDPRDLVSPADGLVSAVLSVPDHPATDGAPATIVRIYLSVFDVHVNRMPGEVEVVRTIHTPGKYLNIRIEETRASTSDAHHAALAERSSPRREADLRQGRPAHRLSDRGGQRFARGERFGMIVKFLIDHRAGRSDFGSRRGCRRKGDRVTGGVTVLVRMKRV